MRLPTHVAGTYSIVGKSLKILLKMVENRLQLFALEVREEKSHFVQLFILSMVTVLLLILGIAALTVTIIFLLPAELLLVGLIAVSALYLVGGLILLLILQKKLNDHPLPFNHSLDELAKDRNEL